MQTGKITLLFFSDLFSEGLLLLSSFTFEKQRMSHITDAASGDYSLSLPNGMRLVYPCERPCVFLLFFVGLYPLW